jgi:predicted ATPase
MRNKTFVGRQAELARLHSFLEKALAGKTQVCFVSGDAGAGKSALMAEFARLSQELDDKLVFVTGNCNAQTGVGDPYLPFRQILAMLTGDETRLATNSLTNKNTERLNDILRTSGRYLVEVAPELVGTLLPGAGILIALARLGAKERGVLKGLEKRAREADRTKNEIEQAQIFLQYTALLRTLANEYSLVIVLDDMQWIDAASNALFFQLARELKGCRILLIGLYRHTDVVAGRKGERHPLEQTINEITRYYGDITIDLDMATRQEGRAFVNALIDNEPNQLSIAFRNALFEHTGGQPLFTVELLRTMQERGTLVRNTQGRWHEASDLDWHTLPAKVEAVIKERIERLSKEMREILETASVEGHEFTTQVIALVQEMRERDLIQKLSGDLERRHGLVREAGEVRLGRIILSRYSFNHILFQIYLYNSLGKAERRIFHTEIATAMEALYDGYTEEIAVQLAHHFSEAGKMEKVLTYLRLAGEKAFKLGEFSQARDYFTRSLDLLGTEPVEGSDTQRAYLFWRVGRTYYHTGHRENAETYYRRSTEAARQAGDEDAIVRGLIGLAKSLRHHYRLDEAMQAAQEALVLVRESGNRSLECQALRLLGIIYGKFDRTEERLSLYEQALQIASEIGDIVEEMACLNSMGVTYVVVGNYLKTVEYYEQALALATQYQRLSEQVLYLSNLMVYRRLGSHEKARFYTEQAIKLRTTIGDIPGMATSSLNLQVLQIHAGNIGEASKKLLHCAQIADRYNRISTQIIARNWLLISYLMLDKLEDALQIAEEIRTLSKTYKVKSHVFSELLLMAITYHRAGRFDEARVLFEQELTRAVQSLHTKRWAYRYHRAFAQMGIALLSSLEERSSQIALAQAYLREAVDYCGWVGMLDDTLLILGEMRKVDSDDLLKPIEEYLVQKREIAWANRPFPDE